MRKAAHDGRAEGDGFLGGTSSGGGVRDGFVVHVTFAVVVAVAARQEVVVVVVSTYVCNGMSVLR